MINRKNIFSLIISLLLAANVYVGPLFFLYVLVSELLSPLRTSTINYLMFPLLWIGFYLLVRLVCEIKRLRHPFVVIGTFLIFIVFSEVYVKLNIGRAVNLNLIVGLMVAIGPIVVMSGLYLVSLITIRFIDPKRRYLFGTVLMAAFLLLMIVIKTYVIISVTCMSGIQNPSIPSVIRNTQPAQRDIQPDEILSIFVTKKCIPKRGGYILNPSF